MVLCTTRLHGLFSDRAVAGLAEAIHLRSGVRQRHLIGSNLPRSCYGRVMVSRSHLTNAYRGVEDALREDVASEERAQQRRSGRRPERPIRPLSYL